jgi:hypothetical protein
MLGMDVSCDGISMNMEKLTGIVQWPVPSNVKAVRSFLGLANFYHCFIANYSQEVRPLHDLTKKDQPWSWGKAQQDAFEMLKNRFTTTPMFHTQMTPPRIALNVMPPTMPQELCSPP